MADQYQPIQPYVPPGLSYNPIPQASLPVSTYQALPFANPGAINIQGGQGFPSFTFDFAQEQANAYNQLRPFYEKLLSFAGGDIDLAKRIIDYTYQQGMRESTQQFEQERRQQDITFPQETEGLQTTQNRRGVLTSGFGATDRARLQESQALRREASERALASRESRLAADRGFGSEKEARGFEKTAFDLERERRNEASGLAQNKFAIKSAQYQGELSQAQLAEQRRIQAEQSRAAAGTYGGGGGSHSGGQTFEQYMASSGKQSEMDRAGATGTMSMLKRSYGY